MLRIVTISALSLLFSAGYVSARDISAAPGVDTAPAATTGPSSASPGHSGSNSSTNGANAQTCTDSCNRSYEVCMDQESAIPGGPDTLQYSNNAANALIGSSSDCSDHLRSCLNTCGG